MNKREKIFLGNYTNITSQEILPLSSVPKDKQDLFFLLTAVEKFWINTVLEKSLYNQLMIALGKQVKPEAVDHPWKRVLAIGGISKDLPPEKPILEIFDELGRALLILGEPGSGKTTTMLEHFAQMHPYQAKHPQENKK